MSLMIRSRNGLWLLAASLALTAGCANLGGGGSASSESSYGGGGIQTSAIYAAPAAKQAPNESRPLSELNTPEAVAAREAAARKEPRQAPAATAAQKPVPASAAVTTTTSGQVQAATDAHQQIVTLQKGSKVRVRSAAALHARPSPGGDSAPAVATEFELGPQIYNAAGYWWYVTAGKESGWLLQTDIQR